MSIGKSNRGFACALWLAVAFTLGCATPNLPKLGLPELAKTSGENVTQERKTRNETALRQFEEGRDLAEYQAAIAHRTRGDAAACIRGLKALLARNPNHVRSRLQLAEVLMEEKNSAEALENVRYVLEKNPSDAEAQHAMAVLLDAEGDEQGALVHYRQAAALKPDDEIYRISYQSALAASEAPQDRPIAASESRYPVVVDPAVSPAPSTPGKLRVLPKPPIAGGPLAGIPTARTPEARGETPGMPSLSDASSVPPQLAVPSGPAMEAAVSAGDADRAGLADRVSYAGQGGDAGFASVADSPGSVPGGTGGASAAALLEMGRKALSEGKTATAVAYFRKAMAASPNNPQIPSVAATAALRQNQPAAAIELLQEAVRLFPQSVPLHQALAMAYYRWGDYSSAQVAAQQALSLDKSSALSYFLVGSALSRLGQAEAAGAHFQQARRIDPRYSATR